MEILDLVKNWDYTHRGIPTYLYIILNEAGLQTSSCILSLSPYYNHTIWYGIYATPEKTHHHITEEGSRKPRYRYRNG